MSFFNKLVGLIPAVLPLVVEGVKHLVSGDDDEEENNQNDNRENERLNFEMSKQISELKSQKEQMEKSNLQNEERIRNLEKKLNDTLEQQKRREIEIEKQNLIKREQEEKRKIEELNKKEEEMEQCKKCLDDVLFRGILEIITNFVKKGERFINKETSTQVQKTLLQFEQKLPSLFEKLYLCEEIKKKISNKFIQIIKNNRDYKLIKAMNFIIIGGSGVGKSTLLNALFGLMLAKEGEGERCTTINKKYSSNQFPMINFIDTVGAEYGEQHSLKDVENDTINLIVDSLNKKDPNEHIHGVVYCVSSNRFFKDELQLILRLRKLYDGKKLPIVIAFTQAYDDDKIDGIKTTINKFLNEINEKISNDTFGIPFLEVVAKEKVYKGKNIMEPCRGLSLLIETLFQKGKSSYQIAIKNSLIEIGKNTLLSKLSKISNEFKQNNDFSLYLNSQFEPNFTNFISYIFDKISNLENHETFKNLEGISKDNKINEPEEFQEDKNMDNFENNEEEDEINDDNFKSIKPNKEKVCIFCANKPVKPYTCSQCKLKACEDCFLKQLNYKEMATCLECNGTEFIPYSEQENENKNIIKENPQNQIIDDDEIDNQDNNIVNILINNLNESSNLIIDKYVQNFKDEIINYINPQFDEFVKNEADHLYQKMLEKNLENIKLTQSFNNSMKSKDEIISETKEAITSKLKNSNEEKYLRKFSSQMYSKIIEIFDKMMKKKIEEFIEDFKSKKNEEIFKPLNLFDDKNFVQKLEQDFQPYIAFLKKKEEESQEKAVQMQYGDSFNDCGGSGQSQPMSSSSYGC